MEINPGDVVLCKIAFDKIVPSESMGFEGILPFDIICQTSENSYLILVPSDLYLKQAFNLTDRDCKRYHLHRKFLGANCCYIGEDDIVKVKLRMTGMSCSQCYEPCPYASTPNAVGDDGTTGVYICYLCRMNKYR